MNEELVDVFPLTRYSAYFCLLLNVSSSCMMYEVCRLGYLRPTGLAHNKIKCSFTFMKEDGCAENGSKPENQFNLLPWLPLVI